MLHKTQVLLQIFRSPGVKFLCKNHGLPANILRPKTPRNMGPTLHVVSEPGNTPNQGWGIKKKLHKPCVHWVSGPQAAHLVDSSKSESWAYLRSFKSAHSCPSHPLSPLQSNNLASHCPHSFHHTLNLSTKHMLPAKGTKNLQNSKQSSTSSALHGSSFMSFPASLQPEDSQ